MRTSVVASVLAVIFGFGSTPAVPPSTAAGTADPVKECCVVCDGLKTCACACRVEASCGYCCAPACGGCSTSPAR
jgi:hypothetical protein